LFHAQNDYFFGKKTGNIIRTANDAAVEFTPILDKNKSRQEHGIARAASAKPAVS